MDFTESMGKIIAVVWEALRATQPKLGSKELREKFYKNINMCHLPHVSFNSNRKWAESAMNATSWSEYDVRIESH